MSEDAKVDDSGGQSEGDESAKSESNDPLHGVTLKMIVTQLVEHYGWEYLGRRISIRCFQSEPSIQSSLKFLRRTPWAREKVEGLYIRMILR